MSQTCNAFLVEVGVLIQDKNHEMFDHYATAYDHKYGYYDENQYYTTDKDKAIRDVKEYVANGVDGTYGIISETHLDDTCFENGKLCEDIDVENENYDVDSVVYSLTIIDKEVHENFIHK